MAWKRNSAICMAGVAVLSSMIFKVSAEKERRPMLPYKSVPSERWITHKPGE